MGRYSNFTSNDRVPVTDGDNGFIGMNSKIDRALLKPSLCAALVNKRLLRGAAETRPGMVTPPALNAIGKEVVTTVRTTTYLGFGLTSGKLTIVDTNVSPSPNWTVTSSSGTLSAHKTTTTITGAGGASETTGEIVTERTALGISGTGQLNYTESVEVTVQVPEVISTPVSQTDTWVVPTASSVGTTFPYLVATSDRIYNPFAGTVTCKITDGMDDDTYVQAFNADGSTIAIPLGPYINGLDHACRGSYYGDYPQRDYVEIQIPAGGWIVLQSWDAGREGQGGTDTILWSGTLTHTETHPETHTELIPRTLTAAEYIAAGVLPAQCVATTTPVDSIWATYTVAEYLAAAALPNWATTTESVSSVTSGTADTIYGAAIYSDPNGTEWVLLAVADGVYRCRWNLGPQKIGIFDGERISQRCEMIQCFDKVILFRASKADSEAQDASNDEDVDDAADKVPLVWDGTQDGLFRRVNQSKTGTGINPIPNSYTGVCVQNRLLVPTGRDQIGISDILDYTRYDAILAQFRINSGTDEVLMRIYPFTDSSLLIFKSESVWQISNLTGSWSDNAVTSVLNPTIGCAARNSVATVGADVFFLSRTGVYRVLQVIAGRIQTAPVPVSDPIEPLINRINWACADAAQAIVFGQYYLLAVPLDRSTVNNVILRFNTVTENWEGYDATAFDLGISQFLIADFYGEKRLMAVDLPHKRVLVLDEGASDLVDGADYPIEDLIETRGYTFDKPFETKAFRDATLALATWSPSYTVTALTDGVNEETVLRDAARKDRTQYVIFGKPDYDPSNANDDQLAPGREDYSVVPAGVYCGSAGLLLDAAQEFLDPLPLRSMGRWAAFRITNHQGSCAVRAVQVSGAAEQTTKETA